MKKITGALVLLSCSASFSAWAQPFYLGDQEISVELIEQVQTHCEMLGNERAEEERDEMADAFVDPPAGLGDVGDGNEDGEDNANGVGEGGTVEGTAEQDQGGERQDDESPDLAAISLEDCKAVGLIP